MKVRTNTRITRGVICLAIVALAAMSPLKSDAKGGADADTPEETAKRQARSVHLRYISFPIGVTGAAVTVTPREVSPGTYFCAIGWNCGYCGFQELWGGERTVIFSVWDPGDPHDYEAKPENVKEEHRARVIYSDPLMDVARFGGEGTGARTMAGYDWMNDMPVRLRVTSEPDGTNRTAFTCWLQEESSEGGWHKLATISTINLGDGVPMFGNLHSFIEDFRRNYDSAKRVRRAEFSDVEVMLSADGKWHPVTRALFSADGTPSENIDAGRVPGRPNAYFMATGGSTTNATTQLWSEIK